MAKRFTDTELWSQDWFIEMPSEYQILWFWVKDKCNHAGIWKPNKKVFEMVTKVKVDLEKALEHFNSEKERVFITDKKNWFLLDFFSYQYGNTFNINNSVHESAYSIYNQENISLGSIRGLREVKMEATRAKKEDRVRAKDKEEDKDTFFSFCAAFSFLIDSVNPNLSLDAWDFHSEVYRLLLDRGFKTRKEYPVPIGRIDLAVFLEGVDVAIELDNRTPRAKSTIKMGNTGFKKVSVLRNPYEENYYDSIKGHYDFMILYKHYPVKEKSKKNGIELTDLSQLKDDLIKGK